MHTLGILALQNILGRLTMPYGLFWMEPFDYNICSFLIYSDAWLNSIMWQIYFQSNLNLFSAGSSVPDVDTLQDNLISKCTLLKFWWYNKFSLENIDLLEILDKYMSTGFNPADIFARCFSWSVQGLDKMLKQQDPPCCIFRVFWECETPTAVRGRGILTFGMLLVTTWNYFSNLLTEVNSVNLTRK